MSKSIDINKTIAELYPSRSNEFWKYYKYSNESIRKLILYFVLI